MRILQNGIFVPEFKLQIVQERDTQAEITTDLVHFIERLSEDSQLLDAFLQWIGSFTEELLSKDEYAEVLSLLYFSENTKIKRFYFEKLHDSLVRLHPDYNQKIIKLF